ncbi:hypothetical protein A0U94_12485 [Gluconobacter albidus]|nr:hypothetical protein A0U94_12485 [Gluconobacter albidus]
MEDDSLCSHPQRPELCLGQGGRRLKSTVRKNGFEVIVRPTQTSQALFNIKETQLLHAVSPQSTQGK